MKIILVATFFILLSVHFSYGQMVTDRPDQTESTVTVRPGNLQIEAGTVLGFSKGPNGLIKELALPAALFRFGIGESFEIRLGRDYLIYDAGENRSQVEGISDLEIGFKWNISSGKELDVAFIGNVITPTGTESISLGQTGGGILLALARDISESTGMGYNLGFTSYGEVGNELFFSAAVGHSINEKAGFFIELYGSYSEDISIYGNTEEIFINGDFGLTYLILDNFQLDFSLGTGFNHEMNFISAGFSWLID